MSLNIKNKVAHELAYEIVAITGESLTEAVTEALEERLVRLRTRKATAEDLLRAAQACRPFVEKNERGDDLYDEQGLPK